MNRLLIALSLTACTATVRTAGPPPSEPAPPPPPPAAPAPAPMPPPGPVVTAPPPAPGQHPAYLQALADLRQARGFLVRPAGGAVRADQNQAIHEIEAAVREIKEARIDDGKPVEEHPPYDEAMPMGDRLHKAHDLVAKSKRAINEQEDNAFARGLKNRAIEHLDGALKVIEDGMKDAEHAPPVGPGAGNAHPAYATAMANLRRARALLDAPTGGDVKFDENMAIKEIDAAMKEIHDARQDDGVPLSEHPPIDNKLVYRDRLVEAGKLLGDAAQDLEQREDNAWAKKDRAQAAAHLRRAEKAVNEAISDRRQHGKDAAAEKKAKGGH